MSATIPLMDLKAQYARIKTEIDAAVARVLESAHFIGGPERENFEKEFAAACGAKFCVGAGNGTDSLMLALRAADLGRDFEVLVPANSFIATSEMVTAAGGKPVFVDVKDDDFLIDLDAVEKILSARGHRRGGKIKAIIPVHLYGRLVDMGRLMALAKDHGLFVLEDCAQSHLAERDGRKAGAIGHAGSFSFYPGKNLGAYGDGGALTTNDEALALRMRKLANHGRTGKYDHDEEGFNSRLDSLQAAILRVKLRHLASWTGERRAAAARYRKLLNDVPGVRLPQDAGAAHVYHLFVIRIADRDRVHQRLKDDGIETIVHYPTALPFLKAYAHLGHGPQDFPVSAKLQSEILSLPLYPEITEDQQKFVVSRLTAALQGA